MEPVSANLRPATALSYPPIHLPPPPAAVRRWIWVSPTLLKHKHIRAILTHGRGGFQTRPRDRPRGPGKPYPQSGVRPQASEGASIVGALWQRKTRLSVPVPPVLLCHTMPHLCPKRPALALQDCAEPPAPPARRRTECRRNEQTFRIRGNNGVGGRQVI